MNFTQLILYQDEDILILNKPAGVLSQKDKSGDRDATDLLQNHFLLTQKERLPFLAPVHRLDRNSSGLLLFAKNTNAARILSEKIQRREIKRSYLAIVKGDPGENGTINAPLAKDEETNESFVQEKGKEAITHFRRLEKYPAASLMAIDLETGRSHQIRAHFAHIRCALLGDKKYAKKPWSEIFARPALHATELNLVHPTSGKPMRFRAPLPEDMEKLRRTLRA